MQLEISYSQTILHPVRYEYIWEKHKGTTGITSALREHYLSHVLLTVKQLCWEI